MAFTRDPETRLRLFVARVDEAVNRRAVREGTIRSSFTLTGSAGQSTLQVDTGDEDDVRSLLIDFRSFVSPQEPVFANWVFNELERRLTDDELRLNARTGREKWEQAKAGPIRGVVKDRQFTAEQTFDVIVNGAIFHVDEVKAATWNTIPTFMQQMMLSMLNGFVIDGLHVLYPTRNIVAEALENGLLDLP